jgi:hypothetical protein
MRAMIVALAFATPASADQLLSTVSGNWAGLEKAGFYFRAELTQGNQTAELSIWNGLDGVPSGGDPQFVNTKITLSAFATVQELQVQENQNGSILEVVNEYADEEGQGRSVVQIQYLDNQFTVIGFSHRDTVRNRSGAEITSDCVVDLWNGKATLNGAERELPPEDFEAMNASDWGWDAAYERGYCPRS